jgi:hypothetical protein
MKKFNNFLVWVQNGFFNKKDFQKLSAEEVSRLQLLLENCPIQNEHGYNFWICGAGKKLIPELKTKKQESNQRVIDCLIIGFFNHK